MFGHGYFGAGYFGPRYFGPAGQTVAVPQVLNYGVMRRRREEYEARQREDETLEQIAQDIAAAIDEGLPPPLRPEPAAEESDEPASFAAPSHDAVTARVAAEIEARLRGELAASAAEGAPVDEYDDDEEAVLALLLAPLIIFEANDDEEDALLALLLAA